MPHIIRAAHLVPGVLFCAAGAGLALLVNRLVPTVSALLVAIVLGILAGNTIGVRAAFQAGVALSGKRLLRVGIVLLGLQISLVQIAQLGWAVAGIAASAVLLGFGAALLAGRLLGMTTSQTLLIGAGFSICGAAAVAAVGGVLDEDDEHESVTALALVVLCGTALIFALPAAAHGLGLSAWHTGIWAGAAVHEVAQVVAIGGTLGTSALAAAVIVKLTRVLLLAPMVAAISLWRRRTSTVRGQKMPPLIPLFVAGFMAMVVLRSILPLPEALLGWASWLQTALLSIAMFALGLGVRFSVVARLSAAPVLLAAITTLVVLGSTLLGVLILGWWHGA